MVSRDAIRAVGDELRLDPTLVPSDVAEFEHAAAAGEYERAAGLYRGPFLDGFAVPDAAEFEQWAQDTRQRLAQRCATLFETAAQASEAAGDAARAVEWWRRLAQHDPYSSRVAVRLCRALEARGDPAGALRVARLHAARLREELGIEPAPAVVALVERLSRGSDTDRPRTPAAPRPLGVRDAEGPPTPMPPLPDSAPRRRRAVPPRHVAAAGLVAVVVLAVVARPEARHEARGGAPSEPTGREVVD